MASWDVGNSGLDFSLPPALHELQAEAAAVAMDAATRSRVPEDGWMVGYDREFTEELGRRGWLGMTWPTDEGGHGRTALERFVVYEQLVAHGAPVAAGWFADRQIGPTLLQYGTTGQRRRWLPGIVAGTSMWCIGISEPDAGSDVASIRTSAVREGDHWVVSGRKVWTSGAALADWCYCVVRTSRADERHGGLSELVVDMSSPGIGVRPIRDMTGGQHFCEVTFDDVRVPADHLVGEVDGSFRQVMVQLEHERGGIDRLLSNHALYRDVLDADGVVDRHDPAVRDELAKIETALRIGRLLVLRQVLGPAPKGWSALTKVFCTEAEVRVSRFVADRLGAAALLWDESEFGLAGRAARSVCYAPAYTVMGGTVSILRNVLAERTLGLPR